MTTLDSAEVNKRLHRGLIWKTASGMMVAAFLVTMARFFDPHLGFTSLLSIGSKLEPEAVTALRQVPHHVYEDSFGYDGAYYVQIAMHPLVDHPELPQAIDNLHYRARRIMLSWLAWAGGLGQPAWIVQVFPLLNILSWLVLAALLWRWLPPDQPGNVIRWGAVLFTHGICMSVRHSLADGPSLLLTAIAVALWEQHRPKGAMAVLAAATLTKETSLLAGVLFSAPPTKGWRWWACQAGRLFVLMLPLALWFAYLRYRLGPTPPDASGLNNFTWPLWGWWEKANTIMAGIRRDGWLEANLLNALTFLALTVQAAFLLLRWRPGETWWRIGVMSALLALFVSEPVWEGYPGAATRVLLPMTLAFNLLVPRGWRWAPVLLIGNLAVVAGLAELKPPPREFFVVKGERHLVQALKIDPTTGWHAREEDNKTTWRWAGQRAVLRFENRSAQVITIGMRARLWAITSRHFGLRVDGRQIWDTPLTGSAKEFVLPELKLVPGVTTVEFATDQPAQKPGEFDPRNLSFAVANMLITVAPASPQPPR